MRETQDPISSCARSSALSDEEFEAVDREVHGARRRLGRVRQGRHRPEARRRAQEHLCLSSPTARPSATRSPRRCARTRTSSSWARTSPRWAARWASRRGCSTSSAPSACATRRSPRWRSSAPASAPRCRACGPVVEVMYEDFLTLSMEQIVNQAAKHRYMSGGQLKVPLTIRTQGGAGWSPGAQHAQQVEAWFVHVPGPEGRLRRRRRPTSAACSGRRSTTTTRSSSSSTARSTGSRKRCPTSSSRSRSARPACTARART